MKKEKTVSTAKQFDSQLATALVPAIKSGKFKLEGIDRVIFMAGQLSVKAQKTK